MPKTLRFLRWTPLACSLGPHCEKRLKGSTPPPLAASRRPRLATMQGSSQGKVEYHESVPRRRLKFSRVPGAFAICRLPAGATLPPWASQGKFFSITCTADELSIVCLAAQVPSDIQHENDWACLKLEGPFPFSETGILSAFVQPLSDRAIPIFAISTFDTDYVLVKKAWLENALEALKIAGHQEISLSAKSASPEV